MVYGKDEVQDRKMSSKRFGLFAETDNHRVLFQTVKKIKDKCSSAISQVKAADGSSIESEEEQFNQWKEHFSNLLKRPSPPSFDPLDQFAENSDQMA